MLYFVCVSRLGGEPLVHKWLFIVYEQFNKVRYKFGFKVLCLLNCIVLHYARGLFFILLWFLKHYGVI